MSSDGSSRKSLYHQAATASAWLLLFPFVVQFLEHVCIQTSLQGGDQKGAALIAFFFAIVIGLGMLTGVILGIVALFGISKYGTRGILVKSLFGILIPLALILLSIPVMMHARERAIQFQQSLPATNP